MVLVSLLGSQPVEAAVDSEAQAGALTEVVSNALEAWSRFILTGDLETLRPSFAADAPQWRQFVSEVESVAGDRLTFRVHDLRLRRLEPRTATVWAEVQVTQLGHMPETFGWDFDLTLQKGRWLVWTVLAATRPTEMTAVPPAVPSTTAAPLVSETSSSYTATLADVEALARPSEPAGTRIPALSAWIVVVTVIGVAVAGYLAPRLDRRRQ